MAELEDQVFAEDTQSIELQEANWSLHWNSSVLNSLLTDTHTHDVTFKTSDGGSVSAHKAIVAASSPVFYEMVLYNGEYKLDHPHSVTVDQETFSNLLTFVYTGKVTVKSTCLNKMLDAACYFKLISLISVLMKFANWDLLNVSNIIPVTILAYDTNCAQLQKCCQKFIMANMGEVARHPNFKSLPHAVILEVCKSSDLNIYEIDLFLAIAEWHQHQTLPKNVTNKIFQEIRYPLISNDDLINKVRSTKLANPRLYTAALEYHYNPEKYEGPIKQLEQRKLPSRETECSSTQLLANEPIRSTGT